MDEVVSREFKYTVEEAADFIGIKPNTVKSLVYRGKLKVCNGPCDRVPSSGWLFTKEAIDEYIAVRDKNVAAKSRRAITLLPRTSHTYVDGHPHRLSRGTNN